MEYLMWAALIGAGATAILDFWSFARQQLLGIPRPDFGLVGRWLGHVARGRLRHESIAASPPVRGERMIGWMGHYAIGIAFASILLAIWGIEWIVRPTIGPALLVGIGTVVAPFLVMQPAMGAGIAASRTPRPAASRIQSVIAHAVFGLGLYVVGLFIRIVSRLIA